MEKYLIEANFHVFVPHPESTDGRVRPEVRKVYRRGQVVDAADIPAGQSGEDWTDKGLASPA